jgi:hypothetical protein
MEPMTMMALAGAGLGAMKSERGRAESDRSRKLAAQLMMTTPYGNAWKTLADQYATAGMQNPDDMSAIAEGGLGGASLGQMFQKSDAQNKLYSSLGNYFDAQTANQEVDDMLTNVNTDRDFKMNQSGFGEDLYRKLNRRRYSLGAGV